MRYNYFLIFLLLCSCTSTSVNKYEKPVLNSKGFAYIYTLKDYENKLIKPLVDEKFPLSEASMVLEKILSRGAKGKIILKP